MARAPDPRIEQAKELYKKGMKLVEIASQLNLPEGTVRRWKHSYNWDNERSDKKSERSGKKKAEKKENVAVEVDEVCENHELTDKQRLFCVLYVRCFNATKAYKKAYGSSYETAMVNGSDLLRNTKIKKEIQRLKQNRLNREMLDEHDIFQKYMDIAFADITDFVEFGQEDVYVMGAFGPVQIVNPKTGKKEFLEKRVNTVRFRESADVDGTLISEIKQGKDGASIKLADRMKALQWLTDHMYMATEEQKARIEKIQTETERIRRASGTDKSEQRVYIVNDLPEDDEDEEGSASERYYHTEIPKDI